MSKIGPVALVFALPSAIATWAQDSPLPAPANEPPSLTVYVPDFRQSQSIPEIGDLGAFASSLIRLELLASPAIDIRHDSPQQACAPQVRIQAPHEEQRTNAASPPTPPHSQSTPMTYYVVCGKFEVRQPESEIVVDYFVERWEGARRTLLFQETQPFLPDHALEQLKIASHTVAYRIGRAVPRTRVSVHVFKAEGDSEEQKQIAENLTRAVTDRLAESQDLALSEYAPYEISGRVFFLKEGFLSRISPKWSTVRAEITVRVRGEDHPLEPISIRKESLNELNVKAAEATLARLNEVRLAERPGWKEFLAPKEAHQWARRANQLLCIDAGTICKQDVPAAIAILRTASVNYPGDLDIAFLLGYAQVVEGNYIEAVNSLQNAKRLLQKAQASSQAIPVDEGIKILNALGDAYRNMGDYAGAVTQYDESLSSEASQLDIIVRKAEAMRFDGKRQAALETLVRGLQVQADSKTLHQAAQSTIRGLHPQDLDASLGLLKQAYDSRAAVRDEYALALLLKGESLLRFDTTPDSLKSSRESLVQVLELKPDDSGILVEANCNLASSYLDNRDPDQAEPRIKQAEELSKNTTLTPEALAWILRLRALYFLYKEDHKQSYESAQSAIRVYPRSAEKYVFAESAFYWAKHLEMEPSTSAAGSGENATPSPSRLYREVLDVTSPLVDVRYTAADWYFREAGHSLKKDANTRLKFQAILKESPNDTSALQQLMYVCNEYLFDSHCALLAAEQYIDSQGSSGPDDLALLVDSAEIAVLSRSHSEASKWLDMAEKMADIPPNRMLIVRLYETWIAVARGDEALLRQTLDRWRQALQEYRASSADLNWSFYGAKHMLEDPSFKDQDKKLLWEMIASAEDKKRVPPTSLPQ